MTAAWLALREPADSASRGRCLVDEVRRGLPRDRPLVIHDLACGTGAMMRWLAPRLPGPQHWVCHDSDSDLLWKIGATTGRLTAEDGSPVSFEVRGDDVTRLRQGDLAGAALITSSALLDLLTGGELERLVRSVATPGCAVLITTLVTGSIQLDPPDPLDDVVAAAFNAHQRRSVGGHGLLGPDAVDRTAAGFTDLGRQVITESSPWRLDARTPELTRAWLDGWLAAAREQKPQLAERLDGYANRRRDDVTAARLRALIHHRDLLVLPERRATNQRTVSTTSRPG